MQRYCLASIARASFVVVWILLASGAAANSVTGWQPDLLANANGVSIIGANTNNPIWGDGADGSTNATAIWASFPTISLTGNKELALTATAQLTGSDATHEQFRFGLFNNNGSSDTAGWLGLIATNATGTQAGDLAAKNPLGENFATSTFGSILGNPPRAIALGTAVDAEGDPFFAGTYNLQLKIKRAGSTLRVTSSIIGGTNFSQVWSNISELDTSRLTFDYNRAGFFAGSALAAEQILLTNIDVSLVTPGDTNRDNLVDMTDYLVIFHHMNLSGQTSATGDVTGDGKVSIADYRLWKDNRTDIPNPGTGSGSVVPEPATCVLALMAIITFVSKRNH